MADDDAETLFAHNLTTACARAVRGFWGGGRAQGARRSFVQLKSMTMSSSARDSVTHHAPAAAPDQDDGGGDACACVGDKDDEAPGTPRAVVLNELRGGGDDDDDENGQGDRDAQGSSGDRGGGVDVGRTVAAAANETATSDMTSDRQAPPAARHCDGRADERSCGVAGLG